MEISLVTHNLNLAAEMYNEVNQKRKFGAEVNAKVGRSLAGDSVEAPLITQLILSVSSEVAIGLFVNWLYDRLKADKKAILTIERTEIEIDKGEITRILTERLEKRVP
ncbi:MAG: hypothetical protein ABSA92_03400 [Candidatus Bathyarchaeia archaeon]|jgi:uncharacterized OB-fold protein